MEIQTTKSTKTPSTKTSDIQTWANLSRSILNGVLGDYLENQHNPLAIEMAFYHQNQALVLDKTLSQQMNQPLSNKVIVLVHGLTNLETVWDIPSEQNESQDDNYGQRLKNEFGFTPFYLRYNTGLGVFENGKKLDELLEELILAYPIEVEDIVLIGFSMGGLLLRCAQKIAVEKKGSAWLDKLHDCFYIGTPHEGSPLEKFGHLTSSLVRRVPKDYINHWADWIDLRSEGIKDLRAGLLHLKSVDADSNSLGEESYEKSVQCGSFYQYAHHYFVSGTLLEKEDSWLNKMMGDSLVKTTSANPRAAPENSQYAHFDGMPHIPLAHSNKVYLQLKKWISESGSDIALVYGEKALEPVPVQPKRGLSNQEVFTGCIDLLATAYQQTVKTVEKMHHSISDEPFSILEKVPVVSDVSKSTEVIHREILDTIYFSLKEGGRLVDKSLKWVDMGAGRLKSELKPVVKKV